MDETITRIVLAFLEERPGMTADAGQQHLRRSRCGRRDSAGWPRPMRSKAGGEDFAVLEREHGGRRRLAGQHLSGLCLRHPVAPVFAVLCAQPGLDARLLRQSEIRNYLRRVAREHGLLPHIRFGCSLIEAAWDDAAQLWRIETSAGPLDRRTCSSTPAALSLSRRSRSCRAWTVSPGKCSTRPAGTTTST